MIACVFDDMGGQGFIGSTINAQLVGVTRDNMNDFWKLKVISIVCSCLPIVFIFLLPTRQ